MKRFFRNNGLIILLIAVLLTVLLGLLSLFFPGRTPILSNLFGTITSPIQTLVTRFTNWTESLYQYIYEFDALKEENEQLKLELAQMEQQVKEAEASEAENERLRTLLELRDKRRDFVFESATIVSRGSSNWSSTMVLSKGSTHGVELGDCVVTEAGYLVGIVSEVGLNWCTIITVIDTDLELGGQIFRTGEAAILEGDFTLMQEGKLKLSYLPEDSELISGDLVVTSGKGGVYPSGLVVGYVEELRTDDSGVTQYAVVVPDAALNQLTQVFIIKDFDIVE